MPTIELSSLSEQVHAMKALGTLHDRDLHRLIDFHASRRAAQALAEAASRAGGEIDRKLLTQAADGIRTETGEGAWDVETTTLDHLRDLATSPEGLDLLRSWTGELRRTASERPETGACTIASALEVWSWTAKHFLTGNPEMALPALDELTEALCSLLAARCLALEAAEYTSPEAELLADLSRVNSARTASRIGTVCAELVFGYRRHLVWDEEGCATCYTADELDGMEAYVPGFTSGASLSGDVIECDGSHPAKAGPCARFDGLESFMRLRQRLDGCLTGARTARDRAAAAILAAQPAGGIA